MVCFTRRQWLQVVLGWLLTQHISCNCTLPDLTFPNGSVTSDDFEDFENQTVAGELTVLEFACSEGYALIGDRLIQCFEDEWTGEVPVCAEDGCPEPPHVGNATFVIRGGVAPGAVAEYSCAAGFELLKEDASTLECSLNGETREAFWRGKLPFCTKKRSCTDPGTSRNGSRWGNCCTSGETLRFTCEDGHELVGNASISCLKSGEWSTTRPLCRPLESDYCEFPAPIPHAVLRGRKKGDYFSPEEEAEVYCEPGYRNQGNKYVECGQGGNWTMEFGVCREIFCDPPPPFENGRIPELQTTNWTKFPYGFEINYACDEGYQVYRGEGWRMCNHKEVWSGDEPLCQVIRCPNPGTPENGMRSGNSYSVGSRLHFRCSWGYDLLGAEEILCQSNRQWTGQMARCNLPSNYCPDPGAPIRGSKNMSEYQMGDRVRFRCHPGTFLLGSQVRECLPDGTWSGIPTQCVGPYDFDNPAHVKHELVSWMTSMKERWQRYEEVLKASAYWAGRMIPQDYPGLIVLYFAFDVSGSITLSNFKKSVDFAKAIVRQVGVSEFNIRVGAITFAFKAEGVFLPLQYGTTQEVLDALDGIQYTGGSTSTRSALIYIRKQYIPLVERVMPNIEKHSSIFILTDGRTNMGGDPKMEADILKQQGVDIYCIGITGSVKKKALYDIASTSVYGDIPRPNVFILQDYATLAWLVQEIANGTVDYSECGLGKENVGRRRVREPWPWMAALYMTEEEREPYNTLQCGGSIIHPQFILTAAHCVYHKVTIHLRREEEITVKLGLTNGTDKSHLQEFEVRKIYVHPNFSRDTLDCDVALLELRKPIQYNAFVRPICLPPKEIPEGSPFYKPGSFVWITEWGYVTMRPWTSPVLKEIALPIQTRKTCHESLQDDELHKNNFSDRMFCAGTGRGKNDRYRGDSGGPVMQSHLNKAGYIAWTQVGVVSWRLGGEYGMYAHLHEMTPWIHETIREAEEWRGG